MEGVLSLIKPPGMTSHDVVGFVRRVTGIRRVGHTGTLDPLAAGLLVLCVGRATRISRFLTESDKCYRAEVTFGISTSTQDAAGILEEEADASALTAAEIKAAVSALEGAQSQLPPMASAVRYKGRKLYEWARRGLEVEREARPIRIDRINVVCLEHVGSMRPKAVFDVCCSKGTYVRTVCADIGRRAGLPAFNSFLLRTVVGQFRIGDALTLEELTAAGPDWPARMCSADRALSHLPAVEVKDGARRAVLNGRRLYPVGVAAVPDDIGCYVRLRNRGDLLAVAECVAASGSDPGGFKPVWVRSWSQ